MSKRVFLAAALVAAVAGTAAAAPQAQPAQPAKPASAAAEAKAKNAADTDKLVELLRKDVRGEKADVVAKTMKLDAAQAAVFWPVYKQYESERATIGTERLAIIQDFAEHYDSINDTTAKGLVTRFQAMQDKELALSKKYVDEFMKVLPAKTAARFFQVDRRINMLIDLELSSAIPLVN